MSASLPARAAAAGGIGLMVGLAFVLPATAYLHLAAGSRRTAMLLLTAMVAILIVRRASRMLRRLLDGTDQPWRLPLLGLYALAAMGLPAALLLLP